MKSVGLATSLVAALLFSPCAFWMTTVRMGTTPHSVRNDATTVASGSITTDSDVTTIASGSITTNSDVTTVTSGSITTNPDVTTADSGSKTINPDVTTVASGSITTNSDVTTDVSGSITTDADVTSTASLQITTDAQLITSTVVPISTAADFGATSSKPITTDFGTTTADSETTSSNVVTATASGAITTYANNMTAVDSTYNVTSSTETSKTSYQTSGQNQDKTMALEVCPEGMFMKEINTVLFRMADQNCIVAVHLSKPTVDGRGRGRGILRMNGAWLVQGVSTRPINGEEAEECDHVTWKHLGPDSAMIRTSDCFTLVTRNNGVPMFRGRNRFPSARQMAG